MADSYEFSKQSVDRIAKTVLDHERSRPRIGGGTRPRPKHNKGFWGKITAKDGYKYSWVCVTWDATGAILEIPERGSGDVSDSTGYAIELEKNTEVEVDTLVWLSLCPGEFFFVFQKETEEEEEEDLTIINSDLAENLSRDGTAGLGEPFSDLTVHGRYVPSGMYLPSGTRVLCQKIDDLWYVTSWDRCPKDEEE